MSADRVLIGLMAVFALLGAADRMLGNHLGIGEEFENGVQAMGSLALAMVGMVCLSPVLAAVLRPVVVPVFSLLGADAAMFAGSLLACDMGGGALARELAGSPEAAGLGGILTGSMLGATVSFTIPVAMGILEEADRASMAKGVLCGVVTVPVGILAGGLTAGYPFGMVVRNLTPIVLLAAVIAFGLWKAEEKMVIGFTVFGRALVMLITVGLAAAIFEALTGIALIPGMEQIETGFHIVGEIAIVLAGAFPLVHLLTKLLRKPLAAFGKLMGINEAATAGLLAALANAMATFGMVRQMDARGKVVNIAFVVSAAFVFGDHLGFAAGFSPELLPAMIVGKLTGGVSAVLLALLLTRQREDSGE